jgi:hypothetical protein
MNNRKFEYWDVDSSYFQSEDYKLNNKIALEISKAGYREISEKYTHIKPSEITYVLKMSDQVYDALSGSGIDLGVGLAQFQV